MYKHLKYFFAFVISLLLLISFGCEDSIENSDDQIPYVAINFTIQTNSLMYGSLDIPGQYAYLNGGYKGILVYHDYDGTYHAFERCCPYDPRVTGAKVWVNEESMMLYDSICGSEFFISDGAPTSEGPASRPLRQLNTSFNPANSTLHIWY